MPIDTTDTAATIAAATTEKTSVLGKTLDGVSAAWQKDTALTSDEAFYSMFVWIALGYLLKSAWNVRIPGLARR